MGRKSDEVDREELQKVLNEHGAEGWELDKLVLDVAMHGEKDGHLLIFKRARRLEAARPRRHGLPRPPRAAEALARGHELTLFTRGIHGAELFPEAERLRGDRSQDVSALRGREFDAVIDTCGYKPADVAASARGAVDGRTTCSSPPATPIRAGRPRSSTRTRPTVASGGPTEYGPDKVALRAGGRGGAAGRVAVVRAGLIVGPHDGVFRLPWWVRRIARGRRRARARRPGARAADHRRARPRRAGCSTSPSGASPGAFNGTGPGRA